jgi:hypothetical protein
MHVVCVCIGHVLASLLVATADEKHLDARTLLGDCNTTNHVEDKAKATMT